MTRETQSRRLFVMERAAALVTEAVDLLDAHVNLPQATAHLEMALQEIGSAARKLQR